MATQLSQVAKVYHVSMVTMYVSTISYNVLVVPPSRLQSMYGGRFKFLTFLDSVSTRVLTSLCA